MYKVETMDKCNRFLDKFRLNEWTVWSMQYRHDDPEGFHAWFGKDSPDTQIELVTHNADVQAAIVEFNGKK